MKHILHVAIDVEEGCSSTGVLRVLSQMIQKASEKEETADVVMKSFQAPPRGVIVNEKEAPEAEPIDCAERLPLCHAVCCRMRVALTEEEVRAGKTEWVLNRPYELARGPGSPDCLYLREEKTCWNYAGRPSVCRSYDCRNDKRVWVDFEKRIPNPNLEEVFSSVKRIAV